MLCVAFIVVPFVDYFINIDESQNMEDIALFEDDVSGAELRKQQPEDCTVLELTRWLKLKTQVPWT